MEIATYLKSTDTLILNGTDPFLSKVSSESFHILKIGSQTLMPYDIKLQANGAYAFKIDLMQESYEIRLNILGKHNIYNSLLAFSVGLKYQVPVEKIILGIESLKENKGRLDVLDLQNKNQVISDCYNASEASVKSALEVLSTRNSKFKIAVLGDILELGNFSQESHENIGKFMVSQAVDLLLTFGHDSAYIGKAAVNMGFPKENYFHFSDMELLIDRLLESMASETCVLVKGSLGMGMAKIVEALVKE
jgi:UDP-N-acetylmuramoyl-tripeptide--D-alanyl-D-alanine ligase